MNSFGCFVAVVILSGALVACGNDAEETDSGPSEEFAAQANEICVGGAQQVAELNLELGYVQAEGALADLVTQVRDAREASLSEFETLEPPADQVEEFDAYLAARQKTIDLAGPQLEALEGTDEDEIAERGAAVQASGEKSGELAKDLGLAACASELSEDDAQAAEDVLREFTITADPATSCSTDGLVSEPFLEMGFGGVKPCEKEQQRLIDNPEELPKDVKVSKVEGVDGVSAFIEYEDVGGEFDGEPTLGTLYYLDGGWKIFSLAPLE